jgi:hypothetical protein
LSLLAETGAHVIASAADATGYATADPVVEALMSHPNIDLLVDLVSFGEPYFITAAARHGTIVAALPRAYEPGIPRVGISAEPGELASLAQRAVDRREPVDVARVARVSWLERSARPRRPTPTWPAQPALALDG